MSMNDDELNELFGKTEKAEEKQPESSAEKKKSVETKEQTSKGRLTESNSSSATGASESKKHGIEKRTEESEGESDAVKPEKNRKKPGLFATIKRKYKGLIIKLSTDNKSTVRREKKQTDVPFKDREFLPNFPLSFKQTIGLLLSVMVVALVVCFLIMPQFRVLNVNVSGNITLSKEELIEEAGIEMNSHMFSNVSGNLIDIIKLDYGKIEDRMKKENPYIKDIQITTSFPSTVNIVVTERNKIAYVKMPDGYAAIDDEGLVIELTTIVPDEGAHAVICGLEVSGAVLLEPININDESDYQKAIIVLGAILTADINGSNIDEYAMFSNVKEIRCIPGGNIFLSIILPSGSQLQVKLKDISNVTEDMSILRNAIIMNTFDGLPDGSFDMTGDEYIYRKYS